MNLLSLWWTLVCAGLAYYCLREDVWRGAARGQTGEAWFYGLYTSALIFQICTLAPAYSLTSEMGLPGLTAGYLGLGAALAVAALAFYLSRGADKAGRLLAMASIPPCVCFGVVSAGGGAGAVGPRSGAADGQRGDARLCAGLSLRLHGFLLLQSGRAVFR